MVVGVGELAHHQPPEEAAHQEDEHRDQGEGLGPDPVGGDGGHDGRGGHEGGGYESLAQRQQPHQRADHLDGQSDGVDHPGEDHHQTGQAHHGGRVPAEAPVEDPPGEGQGDQRGHPHQRLHDAPLQGSQPVLVLEQEVELDGQGDQGEPQHPHPGGQVVEGLDLAQPGEGGPDGHRQLSGGAADLGLSLGRAGSAGAEHGFLLEAAPLGLLEDQRGGRGQQRRDGHHEEGRPPALGAAGDGRGPAHDQRSQQLADGAAQGLEGEDPAPGRYGVGVDQQRVRHRQPVGLAQPGAGVGPK